jgi:hypothetical protein
MSVLKRLMYALALVGVLLKLVESQIGNTYGNVMYATGWTLQSELRLDEVVDGTYGKGPAALYGRGFSYLITGYDSSDTNPGVYIHTNDDGIAYYGKQIWSQSAKLVPSDFAAGDDFGRMMVTDDTTIIVSSPYSDIRETDSGAAFVFNGTLRHWTQIQRLVPADASPGDHFGELMAMHGDRLVVSAKESVGDWFRDSFETATVGAAYVYDRDPTLATWSRSAKLQANDMEVGNYFGSGVGVSGDWVVSTAVNDFETGLRSGSAYMFKKTTGAWSQQQKLMAADLIYWQPDRDFERYEVILGVKHFANSVSMEGDSLALGVRRSDQSEALTDGVYIYTGLDETNSWSVQQRLFTSTSDVGTDETVWSTTAKLFPGGSLVAMTNGTYDTGNAYVFKRFESGWTVQQKITAVDAFNEIDGGDDYLGYTGMAGSAEQIEYGTRGPINQAELWGGTLLTHYNGTTLIHSRYHNGSCLLLWMSDHYVDGWDTAVLTIRAPDSTNDTFHPHCDQVDPFYVRYCPYQPEDEGVYIAKVFAATYSRFYWEISWQVQEEATGIWYKGDFATKMRFNYNSTSMAFQFFDAENLIALDRDCFRCTTIARESWADLQVVGGDSFWPLDAWNAPWYISTYDGYDLISMGKVCENVNQYQCYQRVRDGYYILRLGGGLFGRLTGLPYNNSRWTGCGEEGTDRDQLVFRIAAGECTPIQKFTFSDRCSRPPPIDFYAIEGIEVPTAGGTAAPTINVFGEPYIAGAMYRRNLEGEQQESGEVEEGGRRLSEESEALPLLFDFF